MVFGYAIIPRVLVDGEPGLATEDQECPIIVESQDKTWPVAVLKPAAHHAGKRKAVVRANPRRRAPRRLGARGKATYYRFRRTVPLTTLGRRVALVSAAVIVSWWVGTSIYRGNQPHSHYTLPTGPLAVSGGPSLSARRVDGILAAYGSPLSGHGKDIVALSRKYRVDDAVALAFFVMESRAGTQGRAVQTHSFGNLRPMPNAPSIDGYRYYANWTDGAGEWFSLIRRLYLNQLKLQSVADIVPVYAPSTDSNEPAVMVAGITQLVSCWRGDINTCPGDPAAIAGLVSSGQ
jgi:hypothetical protein